MVEPDGRQVAVPLIADDHVFGVGAGECSGNCGRTTVGTFHGVTVKVVVGEHGAADRADDDRAVLDAHIRNGFSDQFVQDPVAAAGAVVHIGLVGTGAAFKLGEEACRAGKFNDLRHWRILRSVLWHV